VGLYAAFDGELPTRPIFDALRDISVVCLFPRLRGNDLDWVRVDDWSGDLTPGGRGMLEPAGPPSETLTAQDVVLLPGLAFDCHGGRLGRGGGHYDRAFVGQVDRPWLVGVAYAFQCILEVPHDSRDVRIDAVITENGWAFRPEEK
jgi:5-formyltetrahydrofolate cyclo-ligase